jgi:hypothetical protein
VSDPEVCLSHFLLLTSQKAAFLVQSKHTVSRANTIGGRELY